MPRPTAHGPTTVLHGALLIDKPSGPTSHDIVAFVRRALKTPRVGHTGTLDPLATGLLVLLIGHATRLSQFLVTDEKEYLADVRLGQSTETYDAQGLGSNRGQTGVGLGSDPGLTPDRLAAVLAEFRGTFMQTPPPFSAKKVDGVRAYKKARKHEPVALAPVEVTVRELEVLDDLGTKDTGTKDKGTRDQGLLRLRIVCTSGFYVRSLAHDIGQRLGCGAHLEALRRTRVGRFQVADAATLDALEAAGTAAQGRLIPLNTLLADLPAVTLTDEGARRASNGNAVGPGHLAGGVPEPAIPSKVRLLDPSGTLLALAEARADGLLHPLIVLR